MNITTQVIGRSLETSIKAQAVFNHQLLGELVRSGVLTRCAAAGVANVTADHVAQMPDDPTTNNCSALIAYYLREMASDLADPASSVG